ncbi:MAG: IclR family transcriptional regulator [Syntrophobacteraceae bacterium]|nr:IclR family transcriptional regulator [Syntrophobacteraceae bacterium]
MANSIATLEKALELLQLFTLGRSELSAPQIAAKLGMPLSTAYKYLQTLQKNQFLSKNERTNKYYPGLSILKLGLFAAEKTSVMEVASAYMESLVERSLETAVLTVLDGLNVVCVDVKEAPRVLRITTTKGSTLPLYAGSPGKAVLAFKDQAFIDHVIEATGIVELNKNTITRIEGLREELALIRRQGYSESNSEYVADICSVAAPIFDYKGQAIASLSVAGSAERILGQNKENLVGMVKESARGISSDLGYVE